MFRVLEIRVGKHRLWFAPRNQAPLWGVNLPPREVGGLGAPHTGAVLRFAFVFGEMRRVRVHRAGLFRFVPDKLPAFIALVQANPQGPVNVQDHRREAGVALAFRAMERCGWDRQLPCFPFNTIPHHRLRYKKLSQRIEARKKWGSYSATYIRRQLICLWISPAECLVRPGPIAQPKRSHAHAHDAARSSRA